MSIELESKATSNATARLLGAVSLLVAEASSAQTQRATEFNRLLALQVAANPAVSEAASIQAVETAMATYDVTVKATLAAVYTKLQTAFTAVQAQV